MLWMMGLTLLAIYWWHATRTKELAIRHARRACEQAGLQLLDQTVAQASTRLHRVRGASLQLKRRYDFEFTQSGAHRDHGSVIMIGHSLAQIVLPYQRDEHGNRIFLH